jgi:hypothetical protein
MDMNWENQNVRLAVVFVVGLIVGLGLYWVFDRDSAAGTNNGAQTSTQSTTTAGTIQESNGVIVAEQQAGRSVTISQLALQQPSWIAIRDDVNGAPGPKILGAQLFDKGATSGTVALLRATEPGKGYFALIHVDDGNTKAFDSKIDKPLLDASGKQIMVRFQVAGSASSDTTATTSVSIPVINIGDKQ